MFDDLIRLGRYDGGLIPDGCVVLGDLDGEWLVYAPDLRDEMRHACPECD